MAWTYSYRVKGYNQTGSVTHHLSGSRHERSGGIHSRDWLHSETSPGPPYTQENDFRRIVDKIMPTRASGRANWYQWDNFPDYHSSDYGYNLFGSSAYWPDWTELTNEALKNANPNRPVIDLPLFVFELKDVPQLIRSFGISRINGTRAKADFNPGSHHLSYQFGIRPLLNDLRTLLDLCDQIDAKLERLKTSSKKERISGSLPGRTFSSVDPTARKHFYDNTYIWYKREYSWQERSWFTMRYQVDQQALLQLDSSKKEQYRWALGLNGSVSTIWNAIPWTWLIDYFANFSDYLDANRGGIQWKATHLCLMTTQHLRRDDVMTSTNGWLNTPSIQMGYAKRVIKTRKVVLLPTAKVNYFPFLSDGMKTNIAALAATYATGDSRTARIARR